MHRQRTRLAARVHRVAAALEQRGVAATYELQDRALANRRSRRLHAGHEPSLDGVQQRAVDALAVDGYATLEFAELVGEEVWGEVREQGGAFVRETERDLHETSPEASVRLRRRPGKEFVVRAHSFDGSVLGLDDPWFRACTSRRLLDVANTYLRMWSKLSYVDLWYTVPQPEGTERGASQLWHLDFDDKHLLKAFVYLSDVDAESGPFEYVPGSQPGGRYEDTWHWVPMKTGRIPEEEVSRRVPADGIRTFAAPRGTLILCNTSGLHRGGFATAKPRALATATYCSPASLRALSERNYTLAHDEGVTDPVVRYAVT